MSTLTIGVPAGSRVPGLEVRRDHEVIEVGAWDKPLPVDGGTYTISASAPGMTAWTQAITVGSERDAKIAEVPKLTPAAVVGVTPPSPTTATTPPPPTTSSTAAPAEPASRSKAAPLAFAAGALVALGGALAFELSGNSTDDKANTAATDADRTSLWHSANDKRYTAEVLGVAGGAPAGVGGWLSRRGRHAAAAPAVTAAPIVAPDQAGVAVMGRW